MTPQRGPLPGTLRRFPKLTQLELGKRIVEDMRIERAMIWKLIAAELGYHTDHCRRLARRYLAHKRNCPPMSDS